MKKETPLTIKCLLNKKKYELAYKMAKNENSINSLLSLMTTNNHCSHAFQIIKSEKLNLKDFPELEIRAMKKYVRYLLKSFKWEQIELRLISSKHLLVYLSEDIYYNHGKPDDNSRDIALSLVQRNSLKNLVGKADLKERLNDIFKLIVNPYLLNDSFGVFEEPENKNKYLDLKDFGMFLENVIQVFTNSQFIDALADITESEIVN